MVLLSCEDKNLSNPDQFLDFGTVNSTLVEPASDVTIGLAYPATQNVTIAINILSDTLQYGVHFTTLPAAVNNQILLSIPQDSSHVTFRVVLAQDSLFSGTEKISFSISSSQNALVGVNKTHNLTIPRVVSKQKTIELPTVQDSETIFVNFSENEISHAPDKGWTLAFLNGTTNGVILNPALGTTAFQTSFTDLAQVNLALVNSQIGSLIPDLINSALGDSLIDNPDGSKTVFGQINTDSTLSKVFLVANLNNRETKDWYKVKVTARNSGYSVQYAKLSESTKKTIQVAKTANYNLSYLSLDENKVVDSPEPSSKKWDISFGPSTVITSTQTTAVISGFVSLNYIGGATATTISPAQGLSFESYKYENIVDSTLTSKRNTIGLNWRSANFYIIKDPEGYHYKLRFIMEAAKPKIEYILLRAAD